MLTTGERPLTPAEVRTLTGRLAKAREESRSALVKLGGVSFLICGVLGLLTGLASKSPAWVVALFWSTLAIVFTVWARPG